MKNKFRYAFSMIELIFVIIVLGIVASIGSSIIARVLGTYISQKAVSNSSAKTELAAMQISNRLSYAIPWTIVAKNPANPFNDYIILRDLKNGDDIHTTLEWIGVDGDSFEAAATPGWSGYCAEKNSTRTGCPTPGSNMGISQAIIANLSNNGVNFTTANFTGNKPAIFFKTDDYDNTIKYNPNCIGLVVGNTACAIKAYGTAGATPMLTFGNNNPKIRAEQYALSWSAYAIVQENYRDIDGDGKNDVYDLRLYYNYQPWEGEQYTNGSSALLLNNVSVFKFSQYDNTIRFKICVQQPIGNGANVKPITLCKEKAVVR
ncbi:MAG: type II secretion system protein [Sulfurovaceae bacterium]|nr:type II secretion system protein [Sulfurovaceae bacterium]